MGTTFSSILVNGRQCGPCIEARLKLVGAAPIEPRLSREKTGAVDLAGGLWQAVEPALHGFASLQEGIASMRMVNATKMTISALPHAEHACANDSEAGKDLNPFGNFGGNRRLP